MNNIDQLNSKLYKFYENQYHDIEFDSFYNTVTGKCCIHNPIKNIFKNNIPDYVNFLNIPKLFSELKLDELLISYQKFANNNPVTSYFNRHIAMHIFLQGIDLGLNYNYEKFNLLYNKISSELHKEDIIYWVDCCTKLRFYYYFEKVLNKISPIAEKFCECKIPHNYFPKNVDCERLDLVENIIWKTKLNDFFYFMNVIEKIKKLDDMPELISNEDINLLDESMIIKILNYFQMRNCINVYIYNDQFISNCCISHFSEEALTIYCIECPMYCFICGKYDFDINYEISSDDTLSGLAFDRKPTGFSINGTYTKTKLRKNVCNFACIKCKKNIINGFHMIYKNTIENTVHVDENINMLQLNPLEKRRYKPILLIMSNLFDTNSSFALFPIDIIYYIILSIYWNPLNAVPDESFYIQNTEEILYSQFRSIFGITHK